jgi:hypothetical protein
MKLTTGVGEVFFNVQTISHVNLSSDRSLLTVHFVNGTTYGSTAETDEERTAAAEFLGKLTEEGSGFLSVGNEVLNLRSAVWISIPEDGQIQVRTLDNRTRSLDGEDPARVKKVIGD